MVYFRLTFLVFSCDINNGVSCICIVRFPRIKFWKTSLYIQLTPLWKNSENLLRILFILTFKKVFWNYLAFYIIFRTHRMNIQDKRYRSLFRCFSFCCQEAAWHRQKVQVLCLAWNLQCIFYLHDKARKLHLKQVSVDKYFVVKWPCYITYMQFNCLYKLYYR